MEGCSSYSSMQLSSLTVQQSVHFKEWTAHAGSKTSGNSKHIVMVTGPMYIAAGGAQNTASPMDHNMKKEKKVWTKQPVVAKAGSSKAVEEEDMEDMELGYSVGLKMDSSGTAPDAEGKQKQGKDEWCVTE